MFAKVISAALRGVEARKVTAEVDVTAMGLPNFSIVGLPDKAIRESTKRVRKALVNSGLLYPEHKITVNLAPAGIRKEGSSFDLTMAVGILAATGQIKKESIQDTFVCGELALDGKVRPLNGVLAMLLEMKKLGLRRCLIPKGNLKEACLIKDMELYAAGTLAESVSLLRDKKTAECTTSFQREDKTVMPEFDLDYCEVKGHRHIKRGLEIAAVGGHNVLLIGPPGSGKTMLAKRMETIMPLMTFEEAVETTKIYSVSGAAPKDSPLIERRPFRAPHHSSSYSGLIGRIRPPGPGEISLAHNGVLFLDELPEFHRDSLEMLRQPMEEGSIRISRALGTVIYPARFMLIAAMNPCPCGYYTHPNKECRCTIPMIKRYISRVSGPLLDRIDMHLEVPPLDYEELSGKEETESSETMRGSVMKARQLQKERYGDKDLRNSLLTTKEIKTYCRLSPEAGELLKLAVTELNISGRAYDKILRLGLSIADIAGADTIDAEAISEAIGYRSLDRKGWFASI